MQQQEVIKRFEEHIGDHQGLVYKVCRIYAHTKADRQDLFQEILVQAWRAYPRFRGEAKFSTWLYRVAINTAISGLRRQKSFITTSDPGELPHRTDENSGEAEEQLQQLHTAIEQLNLVEKAIVMLYLEEKTYDEMEDILGISQGNLRVKMTRIKEKLRQITQKHPYGTR